MSESNQDSDRCKQAQQCVRKRDFENAEKLFRAVLKDDDSHADAHEGLATVLFLTGRLEDAVTEFVRVTQLDPMRGRVYINLGAAYNRLGDHKKAADALRRGIQKEKKSAQGYYNLGIAQKGLGQFSMAVSAYREAIKLDPEMAEAQQNLGNVYLEMGNHRQATMCFKAALDINPDFERAKRGLKAAESASGQAKTAFSPFGRLVDQEKLAASADTKQLRELSATERHDDRQFIRENAKQVRDVSRELSEHIADELEPSLILVNRIVAQSDNVVGLYEAFEDFSNGVKRLGSLRDQMLASIGELREHEKEIRQAAD